MILQIENHTDKLLEKDNTEKLTINEELTDTFYGQRSLLIKDTKGALDDVSSLRNNP